MSRDDAVAAYRRKVLEHKELETRTKKMRDELRQLNVDFDKTEVQSAYLSVVVPQWQEIAVFCRLCTLLRLCVYTTIPYQQCRQIGLNTCL